MAFFFKTGEKGYSEMSTQRKDQGGFHREYHLQVFCREGLRGHQSFQQSALDFRFPGQVGTEAPVVEVSRCTACIPVWILVTAAEACCSIALGI